MANKRTYLNMGPTNVMRIPEKPKPHLKNILEKFDVLYGLNLNDKNQDEFNMLMTMYEKALDGLIKRALDNQDNLC